MSRIVAQFDPSAGSGSFNAGAVNRCSALWVMNESPNFLQFDFGGAATPKIIQPWSNKLLRLGTPVQTVDWSVVATLQSGSAPANVVFVEGYEPSEDIAALISGPLFRQSNVGNAAAVANATSGVQNDANAPATRVVEATPNDQGSSSIALNNDASGFLKVLSAGVMRIILNVVRGNATTGKAAVQLGDAGDTAVLQIYGSIGPGSVVPASTVQPGALVTGKFSFKSPANGAGNPDTVSLVNGAGSQTLNGGVSEAGDSVNSPGGYLFDSTSNQFLIHAGWLVPTAIAGGNLPADVFQQNGKTIAGLDSAGPGAAGTRVWCGTSDPGPFTVEGDIWAPA